MIVFLTQVLFYNLFFPSGYYCLSGLELEDLPQLVLEFPMIYFFSLVTVLIAASGYLINDYFDFESDLSNNKKYRLKNKTVYLSYYAIIVFIGFILSVYIAFSIGKVLLAGIYILAVAALYLYSAKWKKQALIGNVVVSLFSAFVILILLYAEKDFLATKSELFPVDTTQMFIYAGFAFLVSMVREIIKDIEDIGGDMAVGYRTLPIVYSLEVAKSIATIFGLALLVMITFWIYHLCLVMNYRLIVLSSIFLLVLPIVYVLSRLLFQKTINPQHLSKVCKLHMIIGIAVLVANRIII